MRAERLTETRRFVVSVDYEWTGLQDVEVELTPTAFRWRFAGEARFREATWNQVPATLDAMIDTQRMIGATFGRRRHKVRPPRQADPGRAIEAGGGTQD